MDEFQIRDGIRCAKLHKYIPVAAGMAGGSTDAAAVLYGMNRMFELGLSKEELMQRGVKIGADVPYCIMRGTALAEGIGEQLTALPPMVKCPILIAKPQISVSTKFVYENLKLDENTVHPDIDRLVEDIRRKDSCSHYLRYGKCFRNCDDSELSGNRRDQRTYDGTWSCGSYDEREWSDGIRTV